MAMDNNTFSCSSASDVGRVRAENQDAFCIDESIGLFLVSDGMGGHQAGALASRIVATVLPQMINERLNRTAEPSTRSLNAWLKAAVLKLSRKLREESLGRPDLHGMGATLVMALSRGAKAHIVHMGDSRAYLLRAGRLKQLTPRTIPLWPFSSARAASLPRRRRTTHPAASSPAIWAWRAKSIPTSR